VISDSRATEAVAALKALDAQGAVSNPNLSYSEVLRAPARHLGAFDALPGPLQEQLREFCRREEEIRTLARGRLSQALVLAGAALSRTLYGAERLVARAQRRASGPWRLRVERLRQLLRRTARQSTHLPFIVRRALHRTGAWLRFRAGRRDLATVLGAEGFDDRPLAYGYVEGLRQLPGCVSVSARAQPAVHSQLFGLDFVQSAGINWFLEANCNPVLMNARIALYERGDDPWVNNLLRCVTARGLRRLVVYGYRPFSHPHGVVLAEAGRRLGIDVEIRDDIFFRRHPGHGRAWLMDDRQGDAFVVRAKAFDVLFDRAILSKQRTREIVDRASAECASAGVQLPPRLTPGHVAPHYEKDGRFPNIVGKRDDLDRGTGIAFYKLPRVPEGLEQTAHHFEEYRIPDACPFRVVRNQRVSVEGDMPRAWKIRSYALLTPEGVEYLSSIKVISGVPVPAQLADGEVARKSIYLATINEGGVYSAVTAAEDEVYRRAVTAVGSVLLQWLRRKYAGDLAAGVSESWR
jgi:hypothetical protein